MFSIRKARPPIVFETFPRNHSIARNENPLIRSIESTLLWHGDGALTHPNDNANAKSPTAENFDRKLMSRAHDIIATTTLGIILSYHP